MLTTFVIGLREGLEAALIVGIVGAFLIQNGQRKALRPMWIGVMLAVLVCIGIAFGLSLAGRNLPSKARESMEGTLTLLAVCGVTYMLVWMRHHSREMKTDLEARTAEAIDKNSSRALIALAFVAVIREGLETAIFLFAILEGNANVGIGLVGATAGIVVASGLGYAIYKGGARINLGRFFRVTGIVLVIVAAGLVSASIHSFSEAGLVFWGQSPAVNLTGIIAPGTVRAGLLTAFLGFQPVPSFAELVGWACFLVPAGWYVVRPQRRPNRIAMS